MRISPIGQIPKRLPRRTPLVIPKKIKGEEAVKVNNSFKEVIDRVIHNNTVREIKR